MTVLIWTANILGWPLIHLVIGFVSLRISSRYFLCDNWLTAPRSWERNGLLYRDHLAIRKWKSLLPDAAPWLGGAAKRKLCAHNHALLTQFILETRRAELAHWCMLTCLPIFFLWNPPWARWVMAIYAVAANLPCILVQRYNRLSLHRAAHIGLRTMANA
jgi:glycosyl-4,4'-diaponeurosporenoate acyltransferase